VQRQGSDVAKCRGGKKIEESYTWMSSSLLQGEWSHPFAGQSIRVLPGELFMQLNFPFTGKIWQV
jgi:hypothetical protein